MTQNNGPIDKFQDFPVEIALFEQQGQNGPWINAEVSKTYKQDETYKKSRSFNRNDMLKLNSLVPRALARMQELERAPTQNQSTNMEDIKARAEARREAQAQRHGHDHGQDI